MRQVRDDAGLIIKNALKSALPDKAVANALLGHNFSDGKIILIAIGKAAWQMASAACGILKERITQGAVITKYGHTQGDLLNVEIYEAGHPVPDENSYRATQRALEMVNGLSENDTVLFLISGGGSALFEKPLLPEAEIGAVTKQLLACGADIVEINTIRKRFSAVKGGRFAQLCQPAHVYSVVLSDIIGDPLDMIASGPAYPDSSTSADAQAIAAKYNLALSAKAYELLETETPKTLSNVESRITGSVRQLCKSAEETCAALGYKTTVLTAELSCEAREAGKFIGAIARTHKNTQESLAFIAGGETVVHLTGKGMGGRNQEIALASAPFLNGIKGAIVFSVGSDGTDGPTDAAGGICSEETMQLLKSAEIDIDAVMADNDAYHALEKCDGLIKTGPTGTNVNDLTVLLIKR